MISNASSIPVIDFIHEKKYDNITSTPNNNTIIVDVAVNENVVAVETPQDSKSICSGEYIGVFTWGSKRVTLWRFRKGKHLCFKYSGYMEKICNNSLVFYIRREFIEKARGIMDKLCIITQYINKLLDNPLIIVEDRRIEQYKNILMLNVNELGDDKIIEYILKNMGVREYIGQLYKLVINKVVTPEKFPLIVSKLVKKEYISVNNKIIIKLDYNYELVIKRR